MVVGGLAGDKEGKGRELRLLEIVLIDVCLLVDPFTILGLILRFHSFEPMRVYLLTCVRRLYRSDRQQTACVPVRAPLGGRTPRAGRLTSNGLGPVRRTGGVAGCGAAGWWGRGDWCRSVFGCRLVSALNRCDAMMCPDS